MYSSGEYFLTLEFKTVNKDLWKQVFNKPDHHQKRKDVGVTYAGYSSNRKNSDDMSVIFKYDNSISMKTHHETINSLIEENREKWSALGDLDSIKFDEWRILCERVNDTRFQSILNKTDDVFWMARHQVEDKEKWVTAMRAQQDAGLNFDIRWWGLMENVNDSNEVCCCYRIPRDRWLDFVLNFTESLTMLKEMASVLVETCNIKYVNLEWETMYNEPAALKQMMTPVNDKEDIENIIRDMCNKDHMVGRHHMQEDCLFIRPTGNPLTMEGWDVMMNNPNVNVESNDLVSINRVHISGNMAYACYTTHGKFNYLGTENNDIAVLTSIFEKNDGKWKVVFGQRSSGRSPDDEMPSF